jgi:hypothetical protein
MASRKKIDLRSPFCFHNIAITMPVALHLGNRFQSVLPCFSCARYVFRWHIIECQLSLARRAVQSTERQEGKLVCPPHKTLDMHPVTAIRAKCQATNCRIFLPSQQNPFGEIAFSRSPTLAVSFETFIHHPAVVSIDCAPLLVRKLSPLP